MSEPTELKPRRLASLDATRGAATLLMIPLHSVLIALLVAGITTPEVAQQEAFVEAQTPLATGLPVFFFVTGMSLAVSMQRRRERQPFSPIILHFIFRYGGYILIAIAFGLTTGPILAYVMSTTFNPENLARLGGPIPSLGLTAIFALPLVYRLRWKMLLGVSAGLALAVAFVLSIPDASSWTSWPAIVFLTNSWSVLKTLPLLLVGASLGKHLDRSASLKRALIAAGGTIVIAYLVSPILLGNTALLYLPFAMWKYYHAVPFSAGVGFLLLGLAQALRGRGVSLTLLTVPGRTSLITFYLHLTALVAAFLALASAVGSEGVSAGHVLVVTAVVAAGVWLLMYFYGRWRWGDPSAWY